MRVKFRKLNKYIYIHKAIINNHKHVYKIYQKKKKVTYFVDASSNVTAIRITLSSRFSRKISKFVLSKIRFNKKNK
jgi:virulence-associated protein VapD